jgi:sugar phosphate isomerase/epimerase
MRIGITYLYTIFRYGYPHSLEDALASIPEVRRLGFRFLEMEGLGAELLQALYEQRERLAKVAEESGVHVHNFCVVDPDLVSLDQAARNRAIQRFRMGAEIAARLGCETLHLASYAPPVEYETGRPYSLDAGEGYSFPDIARLRIPDGFDWKAVWTALVESCRACADIAAAHAKTVLMEPRVGETICSVDSLLRLIADVGRANFKANFDTGHFSAQRENVALALMKLRGRFANIHISDNNPVNTLHLPIGAGVIDWREFFRVLRTIGYNGYLGLDFGMTETLLEDYRSSVERIQAIASQMGISVEV